MDWPILRKIDYRIPNCLRPSILWIQFDDKSIGKQLKQKLLHLYMPDIKKVWIPILETTTTFQVKLWRNNKILRRQFPLHIAAAKSIHRTQGETINECVISFPNRKVPALHYVGLSRATKLENIHLLELNANKIHTDVTVHNEMHRLRTKAKLHSCIPYEPSSLTPNYFTCFFHNVQSLHKYFCDVIADCNVHAATLCAFVQTRLLPTDNDVTYKIPGVELHRTDYILHSNYRSPYGTCVYTKNSLLTLKTQNCQLNQLTSFTVVVQQTPIHIIVIYRSPNPHNLVQNLLGMIQDDLKTQPQNISTIIVGDFNIDTKKKSLHAYKILNAFMINKGFKQIIEEPTTNNSTTIDHIWTNMRIDFVIANTLESYYSDHKPLFFAIL